MLVTGLRVEGFRDLPHFEAIELGPLVTVRGPGPAATALGDALELAFAACSRDGLLRLLRRWGLLAAAEQPEIIGDPLPEQATWADRRAAAWIPASAEHRHLTVSLEISLDPVQFSALRALSVREPRVVAALAREGRASFSVGALFATSFDALAVSIHSVRIGDESFPSLPGQRPSWLTALLAGLGNRLARLPPPPGDPGLAARAWEAASAWDGHAGYRRWQSTLEADFGLLRPARGPGGAPVLLAGDLPLRRHGPAAEARIERHAAAWLSGADLLWFEGEDPELDAAAEGTGSAVEQVWRVCATGALVLPEPGAQAPPPPPTRWPGPVGEDPA